MARIKFTKQRHFSTTRSTTAVEDCASPNTMTDGSTVQDVMDFEMTDAEPIFVQANSGRRRFVIAVDYGTTFSAVSFVILQPGQTSDNINISSIGTISDYPGDLHQHRDPATEVPTELWYLDKPKPSRGRPRKNPLPGTSSSIQLTKDSDEEEEIDPMFAPPTVQGSSRPIPPTLYWGYEVQRQLGQPDGPNPNDAAQRHIKKAKLLLYESESTASCRAGLSEAICYLQDKKLIKHREDVITDFLTKLLCHTKNQLEKKHSFDENCDPEFVLCVPPAWGLKSTRIMYSSMNTAIARAGFMIDRGQAINSVFLVSEPEAAATYFLAAGKWDKYITVSSL
jgi:hypothetical protein